MEYQWSPSWVLSFHLLAMLLVVSGCSDAVDGRVHLRGTVTLDGAPLSDGTLTLTPIEKGPSSGAAIHNGEFKIAAAKGPAAGKYRVSIESFVEVPNDSPEFDGPSTKQILPAKYNIDSELQIETKEAGENEFSFDLSS